MCSVCMIIFLIFSMCVMVSAFPVTQEPDDSSLENGNLWSKCMTLQLTGNFKKGNMVDLVFNHMKISTPHPG